MSSFEGSIRVTVRLGQYNPRPFIVKDQKKILSWRALASRGNGVWNEAVGMGIQIQEWRQQR
jgi:hypothetical protein